MSESYYKPCRELEICDELIEKYFNTQQYEKCFEGHLALAEQGYPLAECQVGYFYYDGLGVEKDFEKALWWTRRAADHGDRDGQCNLAWFHEDGIGVEKDMEQAAFWYRQAALQDHDLAMDKCKELGISLDEKLPEAEKVLRSLVRFEPATEDDAEAIIELRKQIWSTTYRGFYPDSMIDDFDYAWHLEQELHRIRHPDYRVYRIVKDDRSIGYLCTRKSDVITLQSLYILDGYQHQGIGRTALDFVKRYCREIGADSFICHCLPENRNARKFYEKMGGQIIGVDMDNEESWMNAVIYRFPV